MDGTAILWMVILCGCVWGGFLTLLFRALRSEGRKEERSGR